MSHGSSLDKIYTRTYIVLVGHIVPSINLDIILERQETQITFSATESWLQMTNTGPPVWLQPQFSALTFKNRFFFQNSFTFIETLGRYFTGVLLVAICHVVNIQACLLPPGKMHLSVFSTGPASPRVPRQRMACLSSGKGLVRLQPCHYMAWLL